MIHWNFYQLKNYIFLYFLSLHGAWVRNVSAYQLNSFFLLIFIVYKRKIIIADIITLFKSNGKFLVNLNQLLNFWSKKSYLYFSNFIRFAAHILLKDINDLKNLNFFSTNKLVNFVVTSYIIKEVNTCFNSKWSKFQTKFYSTMVVRFIHVKWEIQIYFISRI